MENRWFFVPEGSGTKVEFFIDYAFKSRMLGMLMGAMFEAAFRRFSDAFIARAGVVYGKPT
jgi:coenzyme Q-binding protein COQ10